MKVRQILVLTLGFVLTVAGLAWSQTYNTSGAWYDPDVRHGTSATQHMGLGVVGDADANDRYAVRADGQLSWGSGSAVPDLVLSRSAASTLTLASGDTFEAATITGIGTGAMAIGRSTTTAITLDTDGTGTGELVLPLLSVAGAEMSDDTVTATQLADTLTLDAQLTITSGVAEGIVMTHAMTNDTDEIAHSLTVTASDTGTSTTAQYGIYIDNAASTEGMDAAIVIDNSDADDAVVAGILFVDAGGGFTNAIDTAGGNITNGGSTGTITAQLPVISLASGTLTMNTIHLATAAADYDLPDASCSAAADIGNWVTVVMEDASTVISITVNDASNTIIFPGLGLGADDELDSVSTASNESAHITLVCITAENWYVTAASVVSGGAIAWADGGTAD